MATAWTNTAAAPVAARPAIRRIGVADLKDVLAKGVEDFMATPTQLFFLCIIYPIIGLVAARAAWGGPLLPLFYPLASGFALLGPLAALGLYEISRRREMGLPASWQDAFAVLQSPSLGSIVLLGLFLIGIFVAWIAAAQAIFAMTMGNAPPVSIGEFVNRLLNTPEGWRLIIIGNGVGFLFALLALMLTVVSFPMLLDRHVDPGVAVGTSIRAVLRNPVPMAVWGLIVAFGLLIGSIPLFIGLAVVLPILGHATWHLYRKVVA
ncbi:MAG: DUF2189 domain-containing protein [Acetobacteraceae bacterium]|nr:DUF2189 domain-containing protein [Acetobacteraceae bacterium]